MGTLSCIENWHQNAYVSSNGLERILARPDNSIKRKHTTADKIHCRRVAKCVQPPGQTLQRTKTNVPGPRDNGTALINRLKNKGG